MSQFKSLAQSPSSTSSITTSTPDHKEKFQATQNASSAEMPAELDFLGMRDDELFGNPDDTPDEIQGSLERLESLLWPVEDGPDSLLKLSELPSETAEVSSRIDTHNDSVSKLSAPAKEASQTITRVLKDRLAQSVETISRLSLQDFMDLLHQYASYASDPRFDFDQFIGEPVRNSYASHESPVTGEAPAPHYGEDDLVRREETPALTMGETMSPPSEGQLSMPKDGIFSTMQRKKCTVQPNREEQTTASGPSTPRPSRMKRKSDSHAYNSSKSNSNGNYTHHKNHPRRRNNANSKGTKKVTVTNSLSTEFITYRFGITPVRSVAERWECPFPAKDALSGGKCHTNFNATAIRSHLIDHINAYTGKHPHGSLECPFRTMEEKCSWKATGSNTGLPRHIVDVHLKSNAYKCPCGTHFARGSRDQFVRHLRDGHRKNLAVKRRSDPTVPEFVDVDDRKLVEEEAQWSRNTGRLAEEEEDNRGEGSSRDVKRARRF
ncbi:hypothetical protein ACEPAF_5681 [Sanghuangporus sanghuang]